MSAAMAVVGGLAGAVVEVVEVEEVIARFL